jgi:hypothetical protein
VVVVVRRPRALAWAALAIAAGAATAAAPEYQVKAAFLFNFARFVEWPGEAVVESDAFRICVVGDDPFGPLLDDAVRGKTVHDKPVEIVHPEDIDAIRCHIAFFASSGAPALPRLLTALGGRGILTVGETEDFTRAGGVIAMRVEESKVRFDINVDAAQRAGLHVSSQLLKLASRVIQ